MDADDPLWKLIQQCKLSAGVTVTRQALETAELDFGLTSQTEVLAFIAQRGLERPRAKDPKPLDKPPLVPRPTVCSYCFVSGDRRGYIAFYCFNDRWTIKSFKRDNDPLLPTRPLRR